LRVVIVGAGPAGLFAALEILRKKEAEVLIVEKGKDINERGCNLLDNGICVKCEICDILCGVGGSGLFSDGKLNFSPVVGGNLYEFLRKEEANELLDYIANIFREKGVKIKFEENGKIRELKAKAMRAGVIFIPINQVHLGSDNLPNLIELIKNEIVGRGGKFLVGWEAIDVKPDENKMRLKQKNMNQEVELSYDFLLIAPGRSGSDWLAKICEKIGIETEFNPIDVGVRVETLSSVMEEVTSINWDPKFHIRAPTYDDFVRTFCTNPNGYVMKEDYGEYVCVNGYSRKDRISENTNFALLVQIGLTEPLENTNEYGKSIAKLATTIGGGKPLIQRLADMRANRRSTWERIKRSIVKPSLLDVTPGDIGMALPHRIITDILESLDRLDKIIPGIAGDSTLLYAPEIKFYAMRVETDNELRTKFKNIYVAGDGAGVSRGIIGACATGIIAARSIIREMSNR